MRKLVTPGRLIAAGLLLAGITFAVLWLAPASDYIFLPDRAKPVAPLVSVRGERKTSDGGGIYLLDVLVRKATLLESLFPSIRHGSTLVPTRTVNPPGEGEKARERQDQLSMARSREIAAAVGLRTLGYKVTARSIGALVEQVFQGTPAAGRLAAGDVLVSVDGRPVRSPADLRALVSSHRPGSRVRLGLRDRRGVRTVVLRTARDQSDPSRAVIGVLVGQAAQITLPFPVRIDVGDIGGPSAGLAFALDVMEELGRDVDQGYRVAATGELALDGSVLPVGGLKQKTLGARRSNMDVLLVPAGDNAREANRYAGTLRVLPVQSFRQALRALATLPRKVSVEPKTG